MNATIAAVLTALVSLLGAVPELIADVKAIVAAFEGKGAPAAGSLAAQVLADTQPLVDKLKAAK
jgi:hypothetical protein